jgi:hypothetical protein
MSVEIIEIALPSELCEQIDAQVGREHRGEYVAKLAKDAIQRGLPPATLQPARNSPEAAGTDNPSESRPPSRFNPVPIQGEPASVTLLRDRGNY